LSKKRRGKSSNSISYPVSRGRKKASRKEEEKKGKVNPELRIRRNLPFAIPIIKKERKKKT